MELPVEHGLLLDNLLDLAHAPFTHTSTFAKGWSVPSLVKFLTPSSGLQGYWDPYPIDMEFRPPCMVLSTIGISKPGKLEGKSTKQCSTHLHQLHICLPSSRNKTRLLYRMSLDFAPWIKHVPFMHILWSHFAEKVSPKNSEQLHTKLLSISCHYSLHLTIVCGYLCFAYCPLYNIYNNLV
jgi:chlorophyllide a oxygenase